MSRTSSGRKRTETRAVALTRRQRRRQSGAPARNLPTRANHARAELMADVSVADAPVAAALVAVEVPTATEAPVAVAEPAERVGTGPVAPSPAAEEGGGAHVARSHQAPAIAATGEPAGTAREAAEDGGWTPTTRAAKEDGPRVVARGLAERPLGGEPLTPRPGVTTSSHKHPTLALMAEIAARGSTTGPLPVAPARASAPNPSAAATPARAEAETPTRRPPGAETHPLRAIRREPAEAERPRLEGVADAPPSASLSARHRHQPFPALDLVVMTMGGHAALAAIAAILGALLMLGGAWIGLAWLACATLAGCSGGLAYLLEQQPATRRLAEMTLICAQVGMLAWAMELIGPRAALLALAPALAVLAARMVSWRAAMGQTVAMLAVYLLFLWMRLALGLAPLVVVRGTGSEALDAVLMVAGVLLSVAALRSLAAGRERALAGLRAREHKARTLRVALARERRRTEEEADALHQALSAGLRRRPTAPVRVEGPLGLLAMSVNRALEGLAALQEDREERRRLEGALGQLTRALERSWLGVPWSWPETSGTPVDAVVSLLRAPRPPDVPAATWPDDAPTLLSLPTLSRLGEQSAPRSALQSVTPSTPPGQMTLGLNASGSGWVARRPSRLAEVTPPESGISSPRWSLLRAEEDAGER